MALEIERKFLCSLTREEAVKVSISNVKIKSIYLENTKESSTRVAKHTSSVGKYYCKWTEKKSTENSISRKEEEEYLPEKIFDAVDSLPYPKIEKQRFYITDEGYIWEIDFFDGYDFVIAELEFSTIEEAINFKDFPSWIIKEVTDDPFYLNCNLAF